MKLDQLEYQIQLKKSFLCIGLDTDFGKIPTHLQQEDDPIFSFNKSIIDHTQHLAVAIKLNTAFYEAYGAKGYHSLEKTIEYININYPDLFTIADAKRGDIGNTSARYAKAFFETLNFDSITVAPYMGRDSIEPFLEFPDKHVIMLALTSNHGAYDFQTQQLSNGKMLFEEVVQKALEWKHAERLMLVVGATKPEQLLSLRQQFPSMFFLVPGVGAQGGDLRTVYLNAANEQTGLLVNSSRGIIYASDGIDFASAATKAAEKIQLQMKKLLLL